MHRNPPRIGRIRRSIVPLLFAGSALLAPVPAASAQNAGPLIDVLTRKGILTGQEAEEIRTDMQRDLSQTPAGKIKLTNSVTKLTLYGDLRLRYQYGASEAQVANVSHDSQQSRWRYRLRLNADIQLGREWFAGVQLQTGQTPDSGNQTFSNGFNNDNIFISRAYLGWQNDWLRIVAGKQPNPFYTTELAWDPDINPTGFTETISLHKLPLFNGGSKSPWEVTLVAGQLIFGDNNEFSNSGDLSSDPWIFNEQLVTTYRFSKDAGITVAPGFLVESAGHMTGSLNTLPFSDENAIMSGTTGVQTMVQDQDVIAISYNAAGVPTKTVTPLRTTTTVQMTITPNDQTAGTATISGPRTITSISTQAGKGGAFSATAAASGLPNDPSKANQTFTTTINKQNQTVSTTNNMTLPAASGETRALHILTAPGDISFKLGGLKAKVYWDVAYNISGRNRYDNIYQMKDFGSRGYRTRDSLAWLVGFQIGETKKKGDWQALFNYREVGIASVDPNLNDNEVAGSALNQRGFKLALAYQLTDAVVLQASGYLYWNLDQDLFGGRATSTGGIAPYNAYHSTTVELNIRF